VRENKIKTAGRIGQLQKSYMINQPISFEEAGEAEAVIQAEYIKDIVR